MEQDWKWQLKNALTSANLPDVTAKYPFFATPYWLNLAQKSPAIYKETFPSTDELIITDLADPFREEELSPLPGLVQRFPDRILVFTTPACAMRCRHCTRKNLIGVHTAPNMDGIRAICDYVMAHPLVREVLLSGGDPLMLDDDPLIERVEAFAKLPQIDAVRIGTRIPCTLPMRVTDKLAQMLSRTKKVWVNTQFNHPDEITQEATEACAKLVDAGIPVSNQSVLLRGINDDEETLVRLFTSLQRIRVRPYYHFVCDPVCGTEHFRVSEERACELEENVAIRIGGLALPRFVRDIPGAKRKVPVRTK